MAHQLRIPWISIDRDVVLQPKEPWAKVSCIVMTWVLGEKDGEGWERKSTVSWVRWKKNVFKFTSTWATNKALEEGHQSGGFTWKPSGDTQARNTDMHKNVVGQGEPEPLTITPFQDHSPLAVYQVWLGRAAFPYGACQIKHVIPMIRPEKSMIGLGLEQESSIFTTNSRVCS